MPHRDKKPLPKPISTGTPYPVGDTSPVRRIVDELKSKGREFITQLIESLLAGKAKPRHIRKATGISPRQLKKITRSIKKGKPNE
jgi:hypothetical protein